MVYLIVTEDRSECKIGITANLPQRLYALQMKRKSVKLEVLALLDGSRPLEQLIHKRFESVAKGEEWFHYSEEILNYFQAHPNLLLEAIKPIEKPIVRKTRLGQFARYAKNPFISTQLEVLVDHEGHYVVIDKCDSIEEMEEGIANSLNRNYEMRLKGLNPNEWPDSEEHPFSNHFKYPNKRSIYDICSIIEGGYLIIREDADLRANDVIFPDFLEKIPKVLPIYRKEKQSATP